MDDFDARAFGLRVKTVRTWRGIGAKDLALRLGLSDESIYRIERGGRKEPPKKVLLRALAGELGVSEAWLLGGDEEPPLTLDAARPGADELLAAISGLRSDLMRRFDDLERAIRHLQQ